YMLFLNVSYGYTKDNVLELAMFKPNSLSMLNRPENLAQSHNLNFNLSTYVPLGKWFALILWASENYWKSVSDIPGAENNFSRWGFMGYGALNFNLPKDWKISVSGFYLSGGMQGLYTYEDYYTIGCSVSKDFLKKQLNISISSDDLLHPSKMTGGYKTDYFDAKVGFFTNQRRIGITIRYNFGKMYEGERLKHIESDDMDERAKSSSGQGTGGIPTMGQ
ncbi:MAG: outer membrane beta-barrel family protein, partial [Bacteroidales bacterium]|nr:outer membrane beta-barrel family protein [Bacteroidales bacterium]